MGPETCKSRAGHSSGGEGEAASGVTCHAWKEQEGGWCGRSPQRWGRVGESREESGGEIAQGCVRLRLPPGGENIMTR